MTIKSLSLTLLLLATPFLASPAVSQSQGAIGQSDCVTNYDPNMDYFPSKTTGKLISLPFFMPVLADLRPLL